MSWAKVAETYRLKYRNQNVTSLENINYELALSRGTNPSSKDFSFQSIGPGLKEHIYENLLQVNLMNKLKIIRKCKIKVDSK
jgi:hypothetical protein